MSPPQGSGAGDETRTRDPQLGKLILYQLSYTRNVGSEPPTRLRILGDPVRPVKAPPQPKMASSTSTVMGQWSDPRSSGWSCQSTNSRLFTKAAYAGSYSERVFISKKKALVSETLHIHPNPRNLSNFQTPLR